MNILYMTPDFNYTCGRSMHVYNLIRYFKLKGHNVFLCTNGGDSLERIYELNIPVFDLSIGDHDTKAFFLKNVYSLIKCLKTNKIDIVHTFHRYPDLLLFCAKSFGKFRDVISVHTALSIVKGRKYFSYKSDNIIAISNTIKKILEKDFCIASSRINLIYSFASVNSVDEKIFIPENPYTVLFAGRFHPDKNVIVLLKAFDLLKTENVFLRLVGDGEEKTVYENFIAEHNLKAEILPPTRNLNELFYGCSLCVLPSKVEPFPTFMLDSGLYKKPFIGSDIGGITELIINRHNGLLFNYDDAENLARKILILKNDKKLADLLAYNLHSDVVNKFTPNKIIPDIEKLYHRLIQQSTQNLH